MNVLRLCRMALDRDGRSWLAHAPVLGSYPGPGPRDHQLAMTSAPPRGGGTALVDPGRPSRLEIAEAPASRTRHADQARVVLIRPGATCYDEQGRILGALDLPLSDRGRDEAVALTQRLDGLPLRGLYSGPSRSARDTAHMLGQGFHLKPRCLDEFRNLDQGLWQGLQEAELKRRCQKMYRQWRDAPRNVCPPGGEPVEVAMKRLRTALAGLLRKHRGETIGVVVAEPLAEILACLLRNSEALAFAEDHRTGTFETIEVATDLGRDSRRG